MKLSNTRLLSLALALAGVVWCCAIFTITDYFAPVLRFSGGLVFGLAAVVLAILYLMVFRGSPGRSAAEVGAVSLYLPIAYAFASLVSNTLFIIRGLGGFNKFLVLWNTAISVVYIIAILYAEKDAWRLAEQMARTEQKLSGPAAISAKLGEILGAAKDDEIRKQILKLKEAVDYSTNISTAATIESERQLLAQLDELMELIRNQGDASAIQDKLREAEMTCQIRSSAAAARR